MALRPRTRTFRIATSLLVLGIVAVFALGFDLGRRWPFARLERLGRWLAGDEFNGWEKVASNDLPRFEAARAVVGHSWYTFAGFWTVDPNVTPRVEQFDTDRMTWIRKDDMPVPTTHANAVVLHDTVWFAGGFTGDSPGPATSAVWRYVPASDSWSPGPSLPSPRGGGALVALGDTLHYFGGWLPDRNTNSSDHWVLRPRQIAWDTAAPLPNPRGHLSGIAAEGRIFAIGGSVGHDPIPIDVADVHAWDPASGAWERVASLPFALSHFEGATQWLDGRIIIAGGRARGDGRENVNNILAYHVATNTWTNLARLPVPLLGPVTALMGDTLFVGLGSSEGWDPKNQNVWRRALRDNWWKGSPLPIPLGEVSGGVINGVLYLVGSETATTLKYDIASERWAPLNSLPARPAAGDHHASEVLDGELWLLGGLGRNAEGRVQIYNPTEHLWRLGPPLPYPGGSVASALISGRIYVAGGIAGGRTVATTVMLDPKTGNWTVLAPMPRPRNHAASGTDGKRLFVFGGRGPGSGDGNVVANGYDDVQIFDPITGQWVVSDGSPGAPASLPQNRGGMGHAVWLNGEFWVLGGETVDGAGASTSKTYARVDIYNPSTNSWRIGPVMLKGRHGIYPLAYDGILMVAGGGDHSGGSATGRLELIWPR